MHLRGTIINYFFICKRKAYLHYHNITQEQNSELVKIGRIMHESRFDEKEGSEVLIDGIKIDNIDSEYVTEFKKSDSDIESAKWQLLYYLYILKQKGIERRGKLIFKEKKRRVLPKNQKTIEFDLSKELEDELESYLKEIDKILNLSITPKVIDKPKCKKCAYYDYCYI